MAAGRSTCCLTEQRNPTIQYFDWTVPNTPTNEAVLDIRFGCLNLYPETPSVQIRSAFVIGPAVQLIFIFFGGLPGNETTAVPLGLPPPT